MPKRGKHSFGRIFKLKICENPHESSGSIQRAALGLTGNDHVSTSPGEFLPLPPILAWSASVRRIKAASGTD